MHAAATRGCRVTTTTISREQYDYAVDRVRRAGLRDRVTVLMSDYRDLRGRYDKLVSIEMIEAVGWQQIGRFFRRCAQLLTGHGAMLLQAITIDDRRRVTDPAPPLSLPCRFAGVACVRLRLDHRRLRRTPAGRFWGLSRA